MWRYSTSVPRKDKGRARENKGEKARRGSADGKEHECNMEGEDN